MKNICASLLIPAPNHQPKRTSMTIINLLKEKSVDVDEDFIMVSISNCLILLLIISFTS